MLQRIFARQPLGFLGTFFVSAYRPGTVPIIAAIRRPRSRSSRLQYLCARSVDNTRGRPDRMEPAHPGPRPRRAATRKRNPLMRHLELRGLRRLCAANTRHRRLRSALQAALLILAAGAFVATPPAQAATPNQPAPVAPFLVGGIPHSTSILTGHKTMLWLVSTWCGSCAEGLRVLARHAPLLRDAGLRIVMLRNAGNGGYPGPGIHAFVSQVAPALFQQSNWTFGEATPAFEKAYNPRGYADIYFLIRANGTLQTISGAPAATLSTILGFVGTPFR